MPRMEICRVAAFEGTAPGSFPLKGSNWFRRPEETTERAWRSDKALLDEMHASLRDRAGQLSPGRPAVDASGQQGQQLRASLRRGG